ncbi:hypothetical protein V6N12_020152 [Hibiscus sabdariffa]|uniref:Uncharacterized protein n=1 Tax=Hibiscus sabdariffa TaxID=183260 RepID=A0ABR1ZZM8_9ROSI
MGIENIRDSKEIGEKQNYMNTVVEIMSKGGLEPKNDNGAKLMSKGADEVLQSTPEHETTATPPKVQTCLGKQKIPHSSVINIEKPPFSAAEPGILASKPHQDHTPAPSNHPLFSSKFKGGA